jgi:PAS domain-containing protein
MPVSFSLGHLSITPGALAALRLLGVTPEILLDRHSRGDWGDIDEEDQGLNEQALITGDRLLSVYPIAEGVTVWVITEAADEDGERSATTILLPHEY